MGNAVTDHHILRLHLPVSSFNGFMPGIPIIRVPLMGLRLQCGGQSNCGSGKGGKRQAGGAQQQGEYGQHKIHGGTAKLNNSFNKSSRISRPHEVPLLSRWKRPLPNDGPLAGKNLVFLRGFLTVREIKAACRRELKVGTNLFHPRFIKKSLYFEKHQCTDNDNAAGV